MVEMHDRGGEEVKSTEVPQNGLSNSAFSTRSINSEGMYRKVIRKIGVLFNQRASNEKAEEIKYGVVEALRRAGYEVDELTTLPKYEGNSASHYQEFIKSKDLLIVAGGDGTVMGLLPLLEETGVPFYMLPVGNESLFAATQGMSRSRELIVSAVRGAEISPLFFAKVNGTPFFSMLSIGLDAWSVERADQLRKQSKSGKASNFIYARAGLESLVSKFMKLDPLVSITIDGVTKVNRQRGYLIVGNTNGFARGINILPEASASKADVVVGFHPTSKLGAFWRELRRGINLAFRREATWLAGNLHPVCANREVVIDIHEGPIPVQLDGELFSGKRLEAGSRLVIKPGGEINVLKMN